MFVSLCPLQCVQRVSAIDGGRGRNAEAPPGGDVLSRVSSVAGLPAQGFAHAQYWESLCSNKSGQSLPSRSFHPYGERWLGEGRLTS